MNRLRAASLVVVVTLLCGALAAAAGLGFDGAFALAGIWRICLACAVIPVAIAAAGGTVRKSGPAPLALTVAISTLGWLAVVPLLARAFAAGAAPTSGDGSLTILRLALTDAPRQLLTIEPPVLPDAVLLAALGTLVWWTASWSAESAIRAAAAGRGSAAPALLPGLVLLAGTAAGVPRGSASQLWPAAAFVAALALLLVAHRAATDAWQATSDVAGSAAAGAGRSGAGGVSSGRAIADLAMGGHGRCAALAAVGRLALTACITAVVVAVATLLAPALPGLAGRPPADPRALIKPPARPAGLLDPLGQVTAWLAGPPSPLFTVRTAHPQNLTWLVLDHYDGQQWTSGASYLPAGTVLPGQPGLSVPTRTVTARITVTGLPGTWLPAPERAAKVTGAAVRIDPASGMLATLDANAASGVSYRVTSLVPAPDLRQLADAVPGSGPGLGTERVLPPGLPAAVAGFGTSATAGAASPYQQMLLLQDRMLHAFRYNPKAAPGESYGLLWYFVARRHIGGPGVFATLFAVLARRAGFASRIAIGFLPGQRIGPDQYAITTADVLVWPEVYLRGLGWVAFYPLPRPGKARNGAAVRPLGQPASRTVIDKRIAHSRPSGPGVHRTGKPPAVRTPGHAGPVSTAGIAWYVLGGLLALAIGYLVIAAALRFAVRRRWRRHRDPRQRVAGAWLEALSALTVAGGASVASMTPEEVTEHAQVVVGPGAQEPVTRLASLVNAALYGAAPPTPDAVSAAVAAAAQVRRLASKRISLGARCAGLIRFAPPGPPVSSAGARPLRRLAGLRRS